MPRINGAWPERLPPRLAVVLALAGGLLVSALLAIGSLWQAMLLFGSWASSTALILSNPDARACRPHRIVASHLIASAAGLACRHWLPAEPLAIGAAVAASLLVAMALDLLHPPAMGNAIFAFSTPVQESTFLAVATMGAVVLAACSMLVGRLGRRAP